MVKCDPSTRWWATFWLYDVPLYHYQADVEFYDSFIRNPNEEKYICGESLYNGPKLGCEVRFFPKRIKFDPPQQLIDSGEVSKKDNRWVNVCRGCMCEYAPGKWHNSLNLVYGRPCSLCKGKGYKELSGSTFPCALIIMDRRYL